MLFRTNVYVVLAIRNERTLTPDCDAEWHDTVAYTFGISAEDAADAAVVAVRAAENAVDRDGHFVGGVVLEVQPKCVGPEEFHGYDKYLMQPIDEPGVFYVSGITFTAIGLHEANGAAEPLKSIRGSIAKNGLPAPSFVHPPVDVSDEAEMVRIVCPVCERWIEVDNRGLMYSFFEGLDLFSEEFTEGQRAAEATGPFIKSHFACLEDRDDVNALVFLHEDDELYGMLDDSKRD